MSFYRKIIDFIVLLLLGISCFTLSILLYTQQIWTNVDYEQIVITLESLSFNIIQTNTTFMDYIWGLLFFVIVYPLCYIYFNTFKRFCASLVFSLAILYLSGFFMYYFYKNSFSSLYEDEYHFPQEITYTFPQKKRNLVLIYLESFEHNFSQAKHYSANLIPHLTELHKESEYSSFHHQLPGTGFSIASLISSECGIPLRYNENRDIYDTKYFLPQAVCFPEILKANDYQTTIIKASDIHFSDVDLFAYTHGYQEAIGQAEILENYPKDAHASLLGGFGGVNDEALFSFAKKKISEFDPNKPFMLTLFTLDTHAPMEYFNPQCLATFKDIRDAFMCTDKTVYNFVEWLKQSPYFENTTVVLMGDHLLPTWIQSNGMPQRGIYTAFLNLPKDLKISPSKHFSTFDMAPSILESLGIGLSSRSFGLGRSLFSEEPTLVEKIGLSKFKVQLLSNSALYAQFHTPLTKRIDYYTPYEIGTTIINSDLPKFTDAYDNFLETYYVDRVNLQLPQNLPDFLKVNIRFNALSTPKHKIYFIANGKEVFTFAPNKVEKTPFEISFNLSKDLIIDGKLQLKFRNTYGVSTALQLGISPIEIMIDKN